MTLATKIAVLKDGEVQQVGTPSQIYNTPSNLFVADFMGSPAMNLIEGAIALQGGAARVVLARANAEPISLSLPAMATALNDGQKVILGIRPEAITDPASADHNSKHIDIINAHVDVVEPAGADTFVVTHIAGKEVTARLRADIEVTSGQAMDFAFNMDKAVVFDPATTKRIA